jgi:Fur family ferric uptake transcriptional regulator
MALEGDGIPLLSAGFDDDDVHQLAAAKLQVFSQRYTRNRRLVVGALLHCGPSTIAEILNHDHALAQSSTYRSLVVLEEAGVVHRIVTTDDHARFELTEEITGHHHHHLVCHGCGAITDVSLPSDVERQLDQALAEAAGRHRFTTDHHRVDLVGLCENCVDR